MVYLNEVDISRQNLCVFKAFSGENLRKSVASISSFASVSWIRVLMMCINGCEQQNERIKVSQLGEYAMSLENNDLNQQIEAARVAYQISRETLPRYAHAKSPHYFTFQQLGACALLRTVMRLSFRDMQNYLKENAELRHALDLRVVPDYTTLMRAEQKMNGQFDIMLTKLLGRLESKQFNITWIGYLAPLRNMP